VKLTKLNWNVALPAAATVIALLALVFGQGIADRFRRPDVVAQRTVTEIPWPKSVRELAAEVGPIAGMARGLMDYVDQQSHAVSATPGDVPAPALDGIVSELQRLYPDMTEEDAGSTILTAVLLHKMGLMRTAVVRGLKGRELSFPSVVMTVRVANLGGRVARDVDILLEGEFQIVEESFQGAARPTKLEEDVPDPEGVGRTRVKYHYDRLVSGDDYGGVISLWVSIPGDAEPAPPTWLDMKVMHDEGKGAGRVIDGVGPPDVSAVGMLIKLASAGLGVICVTLLLAALRRPRPAPLRAGTEDEDT